MGGAPCDCRILTAYRVLHALQHSALGNHWQGRRRRFLLAEARALLLGRAEAEGLCITHFLWLRPCQSETGPQSAPLLRGVCAQLQSSTYRLLTGSEDSSGTFNLHAAGRAPSFCAAGRASACSVRLTSGQICAWLSSWR